MNTEYTKHSQSLFEHNIVYPPQMTSVAGLRDVLMKKKQLFCNSSNAQKNSCFTQENVPFLR